MQEYLAALLFSLEEKVGPKTKELRDLIKKLKGKVLAEEEREEKLAYPIAKQTEAKLLRVFFALEGQALEQLKQGIDQKLKPLRYLIVKFPYSKVKAESKEKGTSVKKAVSKKKKAESQKETKAKLDKALEKILKE